MHVQLHAVSADFLFSFDVSLIFAFIYVNRDCRPSIGYKQSFPKIVLVPLSLQIQSNALVRNVRKCS